MIKKVLSSRILRLIISVVLIYFAFKKVDVTSLFGQLKQIKLWFVILNILISFSLIMLISYRWSLLLLEKSRLKDILIFTKSSFMSLFYGLFFPTAVASDLLKWIIVDEKYPKIAKSKVLGSVFLDRLIGFSMYMFFGLVMVFLAKLKGIVIPDLIFYLVIVLAVICAVFYFLICFFDLEKIFGKIKYLEKFKYLYELLSKNNRSQILKCLLISFIVEFFWVTQVYFISYFFGTGLNFLSVFIFAPIISIILVLPISIAGFGAREQLFLFFFSQLSSSNESIFLTSTFLGILGVIIALFGGVLTLKK